MAFEDELTQGLVGGRSNVGVMYTPQSRPGLVVEPLLEEQLVYVTRRNDCRFAKAGAKRHGPSQLQAMASTNALSPSLGAIARCAERGSFISCSKPTELWNQEKDAEGRRPSAVEEETTREPVQGVAVVKAVRCRSIRTRPVSWLGSKSFGTHLRTKGARCFAGGRRH